MYVTWQCTLFFMYALQLMLLLAGGQLAELLLRHTHEEAFEAGKHLDVILTIQDLALRPADQLLDLEQTGLVEVLAEAVLDLLEDLLQEAVGVVGLAGGRGDDLIHVAGGDELVAGDALAHDESLVGLGDAEALDHGARRGALGDKPERRERRQQEGVRGCVDEVGHGDQRRGQAHGWAVQRGHQDLRVVRHRVRDIDVVGDEAADDLAADVAAEGAAGAGGRHVCAAGKG